MGTREVMYLSLQNSYYIEWASMQGEKLGHMHCLCSHGWEAGP